MCWTPPYTGNKTKKKPSLFCQTFWFKHLAVFDRNIIYNVDIIDSKIVIEINDIVY